MRRIPALIALSIALLVGSMAWNGSDGEPTADALAARITTIDAPGPLGPLTIFGDSVMYGSAITSPSLTDQLVARGWGPIRFVAGAGFNTGNPPRGAEAGRLSWWIDRWRSEGWEPGKIVINLGSNDSWRCPGDLDCMRAIVTGVLDQLGPNSQVWWPQMTLQPNRASEQFLWNTALSGLATERSNLTTWDWPTVMANGPFSSNDNIHLSSAGYRLRSLLIADEVTGRLATGRPSGVAPTTLPTPSAAPSDFITVPSDRLVDTRIEPPGRQTDGSVLRVELGDRVPSGTTAAALYVTAAAPSTRGFLSVAPCGTSTDASTVNFVAGPAVGAPTLVRLGEDRSVCVTTVGDTHVTVDLQGAFHPDDERGIGFDPLAVPQRLADTRRSGRTDELVVTAPSGAVAVAINITAAQSIEPGFVVAVPCGSSTNSANLNYRPGPAMAASAIVEVGQSGTICLRASTSTHLIVDLTGTFSEAGALSFVPIVPTRTLDTRNGTGGWGIIHGVDDTIRVSAAPPEAAAVTGTITLVRPWGVGFLTGYGCTGSPTTSSVNTGVGGIAPNSLTVSVDRGTLCIEASTASHTLFDTTGWWLPR